MNRKPPAMEQFILFRHNCNSEGPTVSSVDYRCLRRYAWRHRGNSFCSSPALSPSSETNSQRRNHHVSRSPGRNTGSGVGIGSLGNPGSGSGVGKGAGVGSGSGLGSGPGLGKTSGASPGKPPMCAQYRACGEDANTAKRFMFLGLCSTVAGCLGWSPGYNEPEMTKHAKLP